MTILLYVVTVLFAAMGLALLAGFATSRHVGLLLAAVIILAAVFAPFYLLSWWPLMVGFIGL